MLMTDKSDELAPTKENTEGLVPIKKYTVKKKGWPAGVVALPRLWLDKQALEVNDKLVMAERAGSDELVIRVERAKKRKAS